MTWDDLEGYETHEHPDYYDAMCDRADNERKEMKINGEWWLWKDWQDKRAAEGITGAALSLGEFRRQRLEDEAEAR